MSETASRQRIGLYGGTFDPIHIGHLLIAEYAREQLQLDELRFIPAATAPHKLEHQAADEKQRLEMLRLATGGNPHFRVDDRELRRGGTSYTVDTLEELHLEMPQAELVFLMGSDSLDELDTWRAPQRICQLAFVAVVARGGRAAPDVAKLRRYLPAEEQAQVDRHLLAMPQIEISSSEIRARVANARSIRYQLHPAVEAFIQAQGLYR